MTLATVALWLATIDWPEPTTVYLDASWQEALVHAHEHRGAFGNQIIFSAGPLGFLNCHFFLPTSLEVKLAWECVGKFLLALMLVALTGGLPPVRRAVLLTALVLLTCHFPDAFFTLLLVLAVVQWVLRADACPWQIAVAVVVLAFLAQIKFTHCLLASFGMALASAARLARRDRRGALLASMGFVGAFLALWLAAGQNPIRLPSYFRYSWQISAGYPWAMSVDEPWPVFLSGAATLLAVALCGWHLVRGPAGRRFAELPLALFLGAAWFLTWKHGFTRADGHVLSFFLFALFLGIALPSLIPTDRRRWWLEAVTPLCLFGIWCQDATILPTALPAGYDRLRTSLHRATHLDEVRQGFTAALARERAAHDAPALRQAIGDKTVDLFNFEQGLLMLNDLNYRPRPVLQSYSVYTGALLHKNAGHFRGPRAPEFVVVRMSSIDGRFAMQDDSLALAELPLRYDFMMEAGANALFRRKAEHREARDFLRTPIAQHSVALHQTITIPASHQGHPLWLQIHAPLSWIGRLRALFYKPPQLMLTTIDQHGHEARHRILPTIAATGFVIQPSILTNEDYVAYAQGWGRRWLRSIRIEPAHPHEAEFWQGMHAIFSLIPELPMEQEDSLQAFVRAGIVNTPPQAVSSEVTVLNISVENAAALLVHAPGEMTFQPATEVRRLAGGFGLSPGAYTNGGQTDGAEFAIEAERSDGGRILLWRHTLDPIRRESDRGTQHFALELPPDVARLRLLTSPGTTGQWDWTYWTGLRFTP